MNPQDLLSHFSILKDYRQDWKVEHSLSDILLLTVCGVIAGAEGWEEIADFGETHLDWLKCYGDFENGIPSHNTIARVIARLNPSQMQTCFSEWMKSCHTLTEGSIIAIDGKTLRSSYDKSRRRGAIHMISAFCVENSMVIGQLKTAEKSNEITAIPELLKLLEIRGCLVTLDAMGCQRAIAKAIIDKEADYLLAVKGNQPRLEKAFKEHFPMSRLLQYEGDCFSTTESSHGRKETRLYVVSDVFDEFVNLSFDWPGMKSVGVAISFRQEGETIPDHAQVRYYISSEILTAERFSQAVRQHWFIENKLHWSLDVAFKEDACRIRREDAAENLAGIRHIAMNFLKSEKTFKAGIQRKRKKAAMSREYLSQVLETCGVS
ncbi:ISAs1 family transposase [Nitrincola alkalisediminis]